MAAATTYFKLGLFVLIGLVALVAAAFGLGIGLREETVPYHTYFDESVQGLEVGAPVKYRGVSIGSVSATEIAPDRRHVDVTLALEVEALRRLGLAERIEKVDVIRPHFALPHEVRAQLGSQGITGVKFVNIDFFDPKSNPIEPLPFKPDENTIPAAASLMKSVEDSLMHALDRLPDVLDGTRAALARIDGVLAQLQADKVPEAIQALLRNLDGAVTDLRTAVKDIDRARIPEKTAQAIENLDGALTQMRELLERVGGDGGLVASAQRATDSLGNVGRKVDGSAAELERTLRELGNAAQSVRELADEVERDPEMLLKGKSAPKKQR